MKFFKILITKFNINLKHESYSKNVYFHVYFIIILSLALILELKVSQNISALKLD